MKKKIIISSVLIMIAIICIACLAINSNAENTGGTVEKRKDEETFVRTVASTVRANNTDYTIDAETLADELNRYVGSGKTTVTENSNGMLVVTFLATGNAYAVSAESSEIEEQYTNPYLPTGFIKVAAATATTGLTIEDSAGNEYVWVEVPQNTTVYPTAGLSITEFTSDEYTKIENDLHTYTSTYRDGTLFSDVHSGDDSTTGLTSEQYTSLKQKMLKSVYQNGGFYVGKYEAGITSGYRDYGEDYTTEHPIAETVVSQANAYPYNWVRCSQAQTLASGMESGEYTSSLMFGVQWDLVMKFLETKGVATQAELTSDSTSWGNYYMSEYSITNTSAKYNSVDTSTWLMTEWLPVTSYSKAANECTVLTTGADSSFSKMGIYDIAGNLWEWTLEYTSDSSARCALRGGACNSEISDHPTGRFSNYDNCSYTIFRVQALNLLSRSTES